MCFTYYTFTAEEEALGNIGLTNCAPVYNIKWDRLAERVREIGREIVSGKFDAERRKN